MNYITQPGTIPHLAIEHLKSLPAGTKLSTAELAEAIGHQKGVMSSSLKHAREHGAVCSEQIPGFMAHRWWIPADQSHVIKAEPAPERIQHGPTAPAAKPKPTVATKPDPQPDPQTESKPAQVQAKTSPTPRFGIFSDGCMSIGIGETVTELNKDEAKQLARFIQRLHK